MTQDRILGQLIARLGAIEGKGRWHADCPFCGKEAMKGQTHFSLWGSGYKCFVCGRGGSLYQLHRELQAGVITTYTPTKIVRKDAPDTLPWERPDMLDKIANYNERNEAEVVAAWQAYKPLSKETIFANYFSYAPQAFWNKTRGWYFSYEKRLIVPILKDGNVIGFRGRKPAGGWINSNASQMWLQGVDRLKRGCKAMIVENLVDRVLLEQVEPSVIGLAAGGLVMRPEWLQFIIEAQPASVIVAYDKGMTANGSATDTARWLAERRAALDAAGRHNEPTPSPPEPLGPRVVAQLRAAGIDAHLFMWPDEAPDGYDIGRLIIDTMGAECYNVKQLD